MKTLYSTLILSLFLSISYAQFEVLFVDDSDDTFGNAELFHAQLEAIGYPSVYFNAVDSATGPSDLYMNNFDLVVWHTSSDGTELLLWNALDEDNASLAAYLESGGNLWLVGLDFLFDRYGSPPLTFSPGDFVYDYLGIDAHNFQSYGDDGSLGVPQIAPNMSSSIPGLAEMDWQFATLWWVDAVTPLDAEEVYYMDGDGYSLDGEVCATLNTNGTFKALAYYFDIAVVANNQMIQQNLTTVMNYFNPGSNLNEVSSSEFLNTSLFPNPSASPSLMVEVAHSSQLEIRVLDLLGRPTDIPFNLLYLSPGENYIELNKYSELTSGIYFVQLRSEGMEEVIKWVKK